MRDQKQAVVQHEVRRRHRQQHAGHTANHEGDDKCDGPHHRKLVTDATLVHGEQPVEYLSPGRDRDDHCRDAEKGVDAGARPHGKKMVQPHDIGQDRDHHDGVYHRGVAEDLFATMGCDHPGKDAENGQDQDIYLGVTPDPD